MIQGEKGVPHYPMASGTPEDNLAAKLMQVHDLLIDVLRTRENRVWNRLGEAAESKIRILLFLAEHHLGSGMDWYEEGRESLGDSIGVSRQKTTKYLKQMNFKGGPITMLDHGKDRFPGLGLYLPWFDRFLEVG